MSIAYFIKMTTFLPFEIDHIVSEKHFGETEADNLCWSCSTCNGYKGSDVASYDPETKTLVPLYNPRTENWYDHFELDEAKIVPKQIQWCSSDQAIAQNVNAHACVEHGISLYALQER